MKILLSQFCKIILQDDNTFCNVKVSSWFSSSTGWQHCQQRNPNIVSFFDQNLIKVTIAIIRQ